MKIIGHRGAKGLAPENTIAGFRKAIEKKADAVEFDVRTTKDNVAIIHHNSTLADISGNKLRIANSTYHDLKEHKPDLITLKETLGFINGAVEIYVDVKFGANTKSVAKILSGYKHPYAVGSKSQQDLVSLHKALPEVSMIVVEPWSGLRAVHRARQLNAKIISMNQHFLWFGFIKTLSARGYELYAYPLNDPRKARRWKKYGLAGVVTDFPDRFVKH